MIWRDLGRSICPSTAFTGFFSGKVSTIRSHFQRMALLGSSTMVKYIEVDLSKDVQNRFDLRNKRLLKQITKNSPLMVNCDHSNVLSGEC